MNKHMTQDYTTEAQAVADALNAVYENKQTNKKNSISGDYSSDNESYPTVKAVKNEFGTKVTSWSSTTADTNYPSEKLVKGSLDDKLDKIQASHKGKNVVTNATTGAIEFENKPSIPTKTSDLTNDGSNSSDSLVFIETSSTSGLVKNDGTIDTTSYLSSLPSHTHGSISNDGKIGTDSGKIITTGTGGVLQASSSITKSLISDFPSTMTPSSHTHGNITNDGKVGSDSGKPLITTTGGAVTTGAFGTSSGQFAEGNHTHSQYLTSHQSLSDVGGVITVEKQQTAESGYAHTYVIKQGSSSSQSQVGVKINIPKDFLVKSGEVKTVASADLTTLGEGYTVGDKYIDFVVNTKGNDGTDEHIYINVKDLVEDTTYSADNSTLQLSGTTFSIKNKGVSATQIADNTITASQIASKTITASEIADSVVAKNITSTDIQNWNDMVSGGLTTSDVQSEISAFATALANAINPPTS